MKKALFRKLRQICNEVIGEDETNTIIQEEIKKVLEETKPKAKPRKKKSDK